MASFKPGDMVVSNGKVWGLIAQHFGVVVHDGQVIHMPGAEPVKHDLSYQDWPTGWGFSTAGPWKVVSSHGEEAAERAEYELQHNKEKWKYSKSDCNCEHFARYCCQGQARSDQIATIKEDWDDVKRQMGRLSTVVGCFTGDESLGRRPVLRNVRAFDDDRYPPTVVTRDNAAALLFFEACRACAIIPDKLQSRCERML